MEEERARREAVERILSLLATKDLQKLEKFRAGYRDMPLTAERSIALVDFDKTMKRARARADRDRLCFNA